MRLRTRAAVGQSTEVVDADRNGGPPDEPDPLIVARCYDPQTMALLLAGPALLASCNELSAALAGAMRVINDHGTVGLVGKFELEMIRLGIEPGIGVRSKAAVAAAEGR